MYTIVIDMPLMQESCTTDHQCHLSAQDDGWYKGRDGAVFYAFFFYSNGGILKRNTLATFNFVYVYIMNIRVASAGPVFHQLCTIAPSITYFGGLVLQPTLCAG